MKRFSAALALIVFVSMSVFAGEIPTMGAPQPPPPQTSSTASLGEIPSDGEAITISDAALSALMTALGLASI
jgi:hypothetical protein